MPRASDDKEKVLNSFHFAGSSEGQVKLLSGFKKGHHTVPDAANATTAGFLAKLCAQEIAEEGETLFQRAKAVLEYKRKDLSLESGAGTLTLSAKHFVFELHYELQANSPADYTIFRKLHSIRSSEFLKLAECDELFAGLFNEVVFVLRKGAPVEQVIDAVEALGADSTISVEYPSDCRYCIIRVQEIDAEVRFDGRELSMRFSKAAPPSQLWASFLSVRHAFALTKDSVLFSLIQG